MPSILMAFLRRKIFAESIIIESHAHVIDIKYKYHLTAKGRTQSSSNLSQPLKSFSTALQSHFFQLLSKPLLRRIRYPSLHQNQLTTLTTSTPQDAYPYSHISPLSLPPRQLPPSLHSQPSRHTRIPSHTPLRSARNLPPHAQHG